VRETHIMTITFIATRGWIRFDRHLEDASAKDYDAVIIPGGVWNPDTLRGDAKATVSFRRRRRRVGPLPLSATAHGSFLMPD
jgi:protease I